MRWILAKHFLDNSRSAISLMALLRHPEVREGWPLSNWEQASVASASGTAYDAMASVRFIERMVEHPLV